MRSFAKCGPKPEPSWSARARPACAVMRGLRAVHPFAPSWSPRATRPCGSRSSSRRPTRSTATARAGPPLHHHPTRSAPLARSPRGETERAARPRPHQTCRAERVGGASRSREPRHRRRSSEAGRATSVGASEGSAWWSTVPIFKFPVITGDSAAKRSPRRG